QKNFYNAGTLNNNGAFRSYNLITNTGTLNNNGTIDSINTGSGSMPAIIRNYGTFNNNPSGTINNSGTFNNECKAVYNNSGTFNGNPIFGDCTTNQIVTINPASGSPGTLVAVVGNNFLPTRTI